MLWLLLWLIGSQSSNSIDGIVLRAGTRQPLVGIAVGLWPTNRTAKTDKDGNFKFTDVPFGEYSLSVVNDGMKLQSPILLSAAHRSEYVTLEVKPAPAIMGTVFDPNGERAAGVRIQALRNIYTPNGPRLQSLLSVASDDLGDFRLFRLRPGEYYVSASLSDRDRKIVGLRLSSNVSSPDEGFPAVYFGGGFSPNTSQRIRLSQDGDSEGLQIFLKDGPRINLVGALIGPDGPACARVAVVPEGGFVTEKDFVTSACGTFTVPGLSPGIYIVLARNESLASDVTRVTLVDRPPDGFSVTLSRPVNITGRVNAADPSISRRSVVKLSRSARDISEDFETPISNDGSFTLTGIGPGLYDVTVEPLPENIYVSSIRYRFAEITTAFRIDSSPPGRLEIQTARSDVAAAGVVVDRSLKPVPGAQVVLIPRSLRPRADQYLMATADGVGNFRIGGIPLIGNFLVVAFEDLAPGAQYAFINNPTLLNRYMPRGQIFDPSKSETLRLFAVPASETAGGIP
jgi:hypothetical protein